MKKSELKKRLNGALETIESLKNELNYLDGQNEELLIDVVGLKKENAILRSQIEELSDERKFRNYIIKARQLHGVAAHERNRAKDRFIELRQQLERAEKAAMELLDSIGAPVYEALQIKDDE